jgi:hypothetical protein
MRKPADIHGVLDRAKTLEACHGPLMSGSALHRALGFQTGAGFRQAFKRGRLPIKTFRLPGRRDRFALTGDVAAWLDRLKTADESRQNTGDDPMT